MSEHRPCTWINIHMHRDSGEMLVSSGDSDGVGIGDGARMRWADAEEC